MTIYARAHARPTCCEPKVALNATSWACSARTDGDVASRRFLSIAFLLAADVTVSAKKDTWCQGRHTNQNICGSLVNAFGHLRVYVYTLGVHKKLELGNPFARISQLSEYTAIIVRHEIMSQQHS